MFALYNKFLQYVGESRRVVRVLCEYISVQCSRPPPAHSKDLHSTIVAAFNCCASWLFAHPYLATDSECMNLILQVIELGISGSKSQVRKKIYIYIIKTNKPILKNGTNLEFADRENWRNSTAET